MGHANSLAIPYSVSPFFTVYTVRDRSTVPAFTFAGVRDPVECAQHVHRHLRLRATEKSVSPSLTVYWLSAAGSG